MSFNFVSQLPATWLLDWRESVQNGSVVDVCAVAACPLMPFRVGYVHGSLLHTPPSLTHETSCSAVRKHTYKATEAP